MQTATIMHWLERHLAAEAHLCLDSRQVHEGDAFFACAGQQSDGRQYIEQAIARGAAAVVIQSDTGLSESRLQHVQALGVPVLLEPNLAEARFLGAVAHQWYGQPSESLTIIAVTGTNGKTTCVNWVADALNTEEPVCGTIGTLGVRTPAGQNLGGELTTPDVLSMHRYLAALKQAGAKMVALEASSIGLHQGRLAGVAIDVAGFTNLSHDHLDYHGSLEAYRAAKLSLFSLPDLSGRIVNVDDATGQALAADYPDAITYSLEGRPGAAVQAHDIHAGSYGLIFNLRLADRTVQIVSHVLGQHNIANLLLVAGVLRQQGWSTGAMARALSGLLSVDGRLQVVEPVPCGPRSTPLPLVVVDYAHTPDALCHTLATLREVAQMRKGRLVCVFGCGGNRDHAKRPQMGRIAAEMADKVVVTSDNPRDEEPVAIIQEIIAGMDGNYIIEPDRTRAILDAIWQAAPSDLILLAGKGHETWQEVAGHRQVFDDRAWAGLALTYLNPLPVSTDSRQVTAGDLFIALKGPSFDAHDFLSDVQTAGACAALVSERGVPEGLPQFLVADTTEALQKMGGAWRRRFALPVIGVTGSNGKTTTKEMLACILSLSVGDENNLATQGNLNNAIGVPLTLLRLRAHHQTAVIEMGMNHPGEIAGLAAMARPTIAIVTNAQREHQEFMQSVEAVATENGQVFRSLPLNGIAVFPGDDNYTEVWNHLSGERRALRFGYTQNCEIRATQIERTLTGSSCLLDTPEGVVSLTLNEPGEHYLRNALAAAAAALAAGVDLDHIVQGLAQFRAVAGRMQRLAITPDWLLIDDTYNANPDSVRAAIDVLSSYGGKKVLVLGDMAEVGSKGPEVHAEVGAYAREQGVDCLFALGEASRHTVAAFGADAQLFESVEAISQAVLSHGPATVLVKGSRSSRMERVIDALQGQLTLPVRRADNAS